jgi:hypothetical protein
MSTFHFTRTTFTVAALTLCAMSQASAASNAAPFGLEIGAATCAAARAKLPNAQESYIGKDIWLESTNTEDLYPGSVEVGVRCSQDRVIAVQVKAAKGGMENQGSRQAYATLSSKYKRVAGGAMPSLGDGYARFVAGNSVIEQSAPHLSFEFTVTYFDKAFYDVVLASNAQERKNSRHKKESAL